MSSNSAMKGAKEIGDALAELQHLRRQDLQAAKRRPVLRKSREGLKRSLGCGSGA